MHAFVSERSLPGGSEGSDSKKECSACRQAWLNPPSSLGLSTQRQYRCSNCGVKCHSACRQFLQDSCPCGDAPTETEIASALRTKGSFLVSVLSAEVATEGGSGGTGYSEVVEQAVSALRLSLSESSVYCQLNILTPSITYTHTQRSRTSAAAPNTKEDPTSNSNSKEVLTFASSGVIRTETTSLTGIAGKVSWLGLDERADAKTPTVAEIAAHGTLEEYVF